MSEEGKELKNGNNKGDTAKLTMEEWDRLVQGVDDIYFGGLDEPEAGKTSLPKKSCDASPPSDDDGK